MQAKIISVMVSALVLLAVIELIRRERLTFKYALGWMFIALAALLLSIFDKTLVLMAGWFGFELASNFIFFTLLCCFVFLSLLLTVFLCQQNSRNDIMAQKIAILELELSQVKEKVSKS